jgi:hypothetical protein
MSPFGPCWFKWSNPNIAIDFAPSHPKNFIRSSSRQDQELKSELYGQAVGAGP